jgi:DNA polymerase III subunit beta
MSTITVNRNELGNAVAFAQLGLSKRPALPVMGGMWVTVAGGTLELAAFDYEVTARTEVSGEGSGLGEILICGAMLADAVRSLPKGKNVTAEIAVSATALTIACEGTETVLAGLGSEAEAEYPKLPDMPVLSGYADAEAFTRSVTRVAACAGTDDTLPALQCIRMASDGGELEMAATDRYRLGVDRLHWTGPGDVTATVPAVMLVKFAKAAGKAGKVALHLAEDFAGFSDGTCSLILRTSPSEFPKYQRLMRPDSDQATVVQADAKALHAAVVRAGKLGGRNERTGFDVTAGRITVTATDQGKPIATQHVVATVDGPDAPYGFNAGYLASLLAGFSGTVRVGFKTKTTTRTDYAGKTHTETSQAPVQLTADGDTFTAVIMPIRPAGAS